MINGRYLIFYGHWINLWVIVEVGKIKVIILAVTQMKISIQFLNCILLLFIYLWYLVIKQSLIYEIPEKCNHSDSDNTGTKKWKSRVKRMHWEHLFHVIKRDLYIIEIKIKYTKYIILPTYLFIRTDYKSNFIIPL